MSAVRPGICKCMPVVLIAILLYLARPAKSQVPPECAAAEGATYRTLDAVYSIVEEDGKRAIGNEEYRSMYREVERLVQEYQVKAVNGDSDAQFKLAAMYLEGIGVRANSGKAWQWFVQAGGADHPLALLAYGRFRLKCRDDEARDNRARTAVLEGIGRIGRAAAEAVPLLKSELTKGWPQGHAAAAALGRMGEAGVLTLVDTLGDADIGVRRAAAAGLAEAGDAAKSAIPQLVRALESDDLDTRVEVMRALSRVGWKPGPDAPKPSAQLRKTAEDQAVDDATIAVLIRDLKEGAGYRREAAAISLALFGELAAPAVPALIDALSDERATTRQAACGALEKIGQHAEAAAPALKKLARDDSAYTRQRAMDALGKIVPDVVTDVLQLTAGIKSVEMTERRWSIEALARLNERAKPALDELIAALKDDSTQVRATAALALRNLREHAKPAAAALIVALKDPDSEVRARAAEALCWNGPGEADPVPALIAALSDPDARVRSNAALALTNDWPGMERAVAALIKGLDDFVPQIGNGASINAGYALKDMAKHGHVSAVVELLLKELKQSPRNRRIIDVLGTIGPDARAAVPVLQEIVRSADAETIPAAAAALAKIAGAAEPGLAKLIARLHDDDWIVREGVMRSLGAMGAAAAGAVPHIVALLEDHNVAAFQAFAKAAEQGLPEAQFELGLVVREGLGTASDVVAAASWFRKAAEQGHSEARRNLAILYRRGQGVPHDDKLADQWYRQSLEPTVLTRVKYRPDFNGAFDEAITYHKSDGFTTDFGAKSTIKLQFAVTNFDYDGSFTRFRFIDADGFFGGCDSRYNRSFGNPQRSTVRMPLPDIERLHRMIAVLPEGIGFAPLGQRVIVSAHDAGRWTTRIYDAEALPRVVRNLVELVGLPAEAAAYPPQEAASWASPTRPPIGLAYEPRGTLLSWGYGRTMNRWQPGAGPKADVDRIGPLPGFPIAVAGRTSRVVTSERRRLRLVDLPSGKVLAELSESRDYNDRGRDAAFSGDGRTLVLLESQQRRVHIWDAVTAQKRGTIQLDEFFDFAPAVSDDGRRMALAFGRKATGVWDLTTMKLEREFTGGEPTSLAFSPDGKSLAVEGPITLTVWNVETQEKRWEVQSGNWSGPVCYSPDGAILAQTRRRPLTCLRDARDGRVLGIAEGHTGDLRSITSIAFSPDGESFATGGSDGLIKLWGVSDVLRNDWDQ